MTDDEFLKAVALRMGRTPQQVLQRYVVLPCACGNGTCCGWLTILRTDLKLRDDHMRRNHPRPTHGIGEDDYLAREQRRLKGRTYTWAQLPKEKP